MSRRSIIIVAGGAGRRMGGDIPKQFLQVAGQEIIVRTVRRVMEALPDACVVLALPKEYMDLWNSLALRHGISGVRVTEGGSTRYMSVRGALDAIDGSCGVIGVHDAVRPFASADMIRELFSTAERCGSAVPAVPVTDTVRALSGSGSVTVDRSVLRAVQTPQVFRADMLRRAYRMEDDGLVTDDAGAVERAGEGVTLCQGERENIKITTPMDLRVAEVIAAMQDGGEI